MKFKKIMSLLVVLVMLFGITINAGVVKADNSSGDYSYAVNSDGTITITKYNGTCVDVVIPSQIDGKRVTEIGNYAFSGSKINSVVVSNGVIEIGDSAFNNCAKLTTIKLSNNLTTIGSWAFFYCTGLKSVMIPKHVTSIQEGAFANCTTLKATYFRGDSPSEIDTTAFKFVTVLEHVKWRMNLGLKIYYKPNSKGFTSETWNEYNTALYEDTNRFIVNVMDSNTKDPIFGATVKVGDQTAVTDDKGSAEFLNINWGTADIDITEDGYDESSYEKYNIPANNGCYFTFLDQTEQ